ncbi:hypothetical protein BOX15_Mlig020507g1 [Macrostomum lignano]|uniref:Uncharacterized protein n=1 Tax=Macrostomum lignano TaxID=282301 RepID=A0A267GPE6_9PLAT|nr:hypothetical protein BOX15_Mlig020507g1 [Macrostomum lignano]
MAVCQLCLATVICVSALLNSVCWAYPQFAASVAAPASIEAVIVQPVSKKNPHWLMQLRQLLANLREDEQLDKEERANEAADRAVNQIRKRCRIGRTACMLG